MSLVRLFTQSARMRLNPAITPFHARSLASSASITSSPVSLSWTQYFDQKSKLKTFERISSIAGFSLFFFGGSYYFMAVAEFDPTELVFGVMDASMAYSLGALGVGVLGGVAGVFAGTAVWRTVTNRRILEAIDAKDVEFFKRIQQYRPQGQLRLSVDNPMPDYYGESIKSVQGYRAWLKKQRNYRIKTEGFHARKSIKRK
ncbi:TIM23 complex component [Chytriomyces hyalinus]|nr:TIM23 complex component [Chytriomyces hyalinus]